MKADKCTWKLVHRFFVEHMRKRGILSADVARSNIRKALLSEIELKMLCYAQTHKMCEKYQKLVKS